MSTSPRHCFFCGVSLTNETSSNEHIIPNSIGGRKKTRNFICKQCNNTFGETWDNELARQTNFFMVLINGKRERGSIPKERVSTLGGQEFFYDATGELSPDKPKISIEQKNEKIIFNISVRDKKELKSVLMGLCRKYPNINIDVLMQQVKVSRSYLKDNVIQKTLTFGGPESGRSFVKSCLALASTAAIDDDYIISKKYLKDGDSKHKNWNYCKDSFVINSDQLNIFHCVHVEALPDKHIIIGYIEYFSCIRILMLLSDTYHRKEHKITYAVNPVTGKEVSANISLNIEADEIKNIINSIYNQDTIQKSIENFIQRALPIAWKNQCDNVIKNAFQTALRECDIKEGDYLTDEKMRKFSSLIARDVTDFVMHGITSKRQADILFQKNDSKVT